MHVQLLSILFSTLVLPCPRLGPVPAPQPAAQERRGSDEWVEDAIRYLPPYQNEHRWFLTESQRTDAMAAALILDAATTLTPDHLRALWWTGHAHILLGEDDRNRGRADAATEHDRRAQAALDHAISVDESDPWSHYARALLLANSGRELEAIQGLESVIALSEAATEPSNFAQLRYQALEWKIEFRTRTRDYATAEQELYAFCGEFAENDWPLQRLLATQRLRRRVFVGARDNYRRMIADFADDPQAYEWLGNLEGLEGNREQAAVCLQESIDRERMPGLYGRMWMWILSAGETQQKAETELREFIEYPPDTLSDWDRKLGEFLLGDETSESFLARAQSERNLRMSEARPLDGLMCESWFYIGYKLEQQARVGESAVSLDKDRATRSLEAYGRCLAERPTGWKWEWAHARTNYSQLAKELGREARTDFILAADKLQIDGRTARVLSSAWHSPGDPRPTSESSGAPLPGDLLMLTVEWSDGAFEAIDLLVTVN
ncbi:MAG: tetratricopeptide (TPR) repeat protein [Planctomycetota bacterium]|jgi:tetratricopeptide (TPR) repeat protein